MNIKHIFFAFFLCCLNLNQDVKINSLARSSHGDWTLYTTDNNGSFGTYDTVMLATHIDAAWRILDASRIQLREYGFLYGIVIIKLSIHNAKQFIWYILLLFIFVSMPGEGLAKRSSPIWAIMAAWRGIDGLFGTKF